MSRNEFSMYSEAFLASDPLLKALQEHHSELMPTDAPPQKPPAKSLVQAPQTPAPILTKGTPSYMPRRIIQVTREVFNVLEPDFFTSPKRPCSRARSAAAYLIRKHCQWMGFVNIGKEIGGKDHTTVISGIRYVHKLIDPMHPRYSPTFAEQIRILEERVEAIKAET